VLPHPGRFRLSLVAAFFARPLAPVLKALGGPLKPLGAMLELAPSRAPVRSRISGPGSFAPQAAKRQGRVALLTGCAQPVLQPSINEATIALLNRAGVEVVLPRGEGCCGALVHGATSTPGCARSMARDWMRS
jgi:glycolate oxidase iron-sulfur subunit